MANTRKPKRADRAAPASRKSAGKAPRAPRKRELDDLTPERLRQMWALENPDEPLVRAALERLYRRGY